MMNWRTVIGLILLFGAISEMFSVISDFRTGKLTYWPFGVEVGFIAITLLAIYLIRKGQKEKALR